MTYQITASNNKLDKEMSSEQFNQILEAILDGKYSWACVLMLRFAGHNPLHYIPYRTYNRLAKQNCQNGRQNQDKAGNSSETSSSRNYLNRITDLAHLEVVDNQSPQVRGGYFKQWFGASHTSHKFSVVDW